MLLVRGAAMPSPSTYGTNAVRWDTSTLAEQPSDPAMPFFSRLYSTVEVSMFNLLVAWPALIFSFEVDSGVQVGVSQWPRAPHATVVPSHEGHIRVKAPSATPF